MKCSRCGNEDPAYFYKGSRGYYCRKCVKYSRVLLEEELKSFDYEIGYDADEYRFAYDLTDQQKEASGRCLKALEKGDVLLHCVCGAGKTEIVVASIAAYLGKGLKVAYAIPRKEVVIELSERFKAIFPKAKITSVYGSHHEELSGDLIVCTCHQLYRYYRTFDLLILDEADAFPLKGDETLFQIALNSCKGRIIFSTATIDAQLQKAVRLRHAETVELFVRPTGRPLSVPRLIVSDRILSYVLLIILLWRSSRQCIIFTENRRDCRSLYRICSVFFSCTYVYSDLENRRKNIDDFRKGKFRFIFATTVLERGITIAGIDVIIMDTGASFDEGALIQMLGRVGRSVHDEDGRSYLFCSPADRQVRKTLLYLKEANSRL